MSIFSSTANLAKALRMERWPIVGPAVRAGGRGLNEWLHRDGVQALVDGEIPLTLSPRAFSGGAYRFDPALISELKQLAKPGRHFLDAGAHMGIAGLAYSSLAGPDTRIVAFEPNPNVFPLLIENSRVNGMRVECFHMALGKEIGTVDFFTDGKNPNASLSQEAPGKYWYWEGRPMPAMKSSRVMMTTIDRICSAIGFRPGVIKMDVEGAELQVLQGATETLRTCRPDILLETHVFAWQSFGYDGETLARVIEEMGYRVCNGQGQPFAGPLGSGPEPDNNHFLLLPR